MDYNGNIINQIYDATNNPGLFASTALPYDGGNTNHLSDLSLYINSKSYQVVYLMTDFVDKYVEAFAYINAKLDNYVQGQVSAGHGPNIIEDYLGWYLILGTNGGYYFINRHDPDNLANANTLWQSQNCCPSANVNDTYPARWTKVDDIFFVILYTLGTFIKCDIFIYSATITDLVTPGKSIYSSIE